MTREEAIDWLARMKSNTVNHTLDMPLWWNEPLAEALEMAIKALEQESVLDKIEEEIKDTLYVDSLIFTEMIDFKNGKIDADDVIEEFNRVTRTEILKIIDKHKIESIGEIKGE